MIRMIQCQTSAQSKKYFADALSKSDYYLDDQEMNGSFHGGVAKHLGLENQMVTKDVFDQLCDNINPLTGDNLTPRTRDDRTVGYDINFHCPKSVSLLHGIKGDKRILPAFQRAVHETMLDIEKDMQTRVRLDGKDENRSAPHLIWADFVHQTARPVKGDITDPHLHCHNMVLNIVIDPVEKRMKAGQFRHIKRDMPYYQARFHKRLADNIQDLGYDIRKTYSAFEVAHISQKAIDHFSKRTDEIGRFARENNITDKGELDQLGARTRAKKQKGLSMKQLNSQWQKQLDADNIDLLDVRSHSRPRNLPIAKGRDCVNHALDDVFERSSVMRDRKILAQAFRYGIGHKDIKIDEIETHFKKDSRIYHIYENGEKLCTTLTVQKQEQEMVNIARTMRGNCQPIRLNIDKVDMSGLNTEQSNAVAHVLTSGDQLTMIKGSAGTGKTTLMKKAVKAIEQGNRKVSVFAPTASASRDVLRGEGFKNADTVAKLLNDKGLQKKMSGQVIWVDEAGLLGTQEMTGLLRITQERNARLVLSGDTRQHASVKRGDAMRIINKIAKIPFASTKRIYRQKVQEYRKAVEALSEGDVRQGFGDLERMGALQELKGDALTQQLAQDYLNALKAKKTALVISPTNAQAKAVTEEIRKHCKADQLIGKRDKSFERLSSFHWTQAQKQDSRNYQIGMVVQAHQNLKEIKRGEKLVVSEFGKTSVLVENRRGVKIKLPLDRADKFDVYLQDRIDLSVGDRIRITKNSQDVNKQRLDNDKILIINRFNPDGSITAQHGSRRNAKEYRIPKDFANFNHAYCLTSYGSQGKTVDQVFIAQPADTFPATNDKQFYVSASRGREKIKIYTDDKAALLSHAMKGGDRISALELSEKIIQRKIQDFDINREDMIKPKKPKSYEPEI